MEVVSKAIEAYATGDAARAADLSEEAKHYASRSGRVRELAGLSAYAASRWQNAIRDLLTFKRMTGSIEQNHVIADCYRALQKPDRAIEVLNEVDKQSVSPELWSEVTIVAAAALTDQNRLDEALRRLARAELEPRSVEPHHLRLWYVRAEILEKAGRNAEAREVWERIYAEDPDFYDVAERVRS